MTTQTVFHFSWIYIFSFSATPRSLQILSTWPAERDRLRPTTPRATVLIIWQLFSRYSSFFPISGGPKILVVRTIARISVISRISQPKQKIFVFLFWFNARFVTLPLTKDLYRRMSAKHCICSEWRWPFSFNGVENWLLSRIMWGTKRLKPFFRLYKASEVLHKYVMGVWPDNFTAAFSLVSMWPFLLLISRKFKVK